MKRMVNQVLRTMGYSVISTRSLSALQAAQDVGAAAGAAPAPQPVVPDAAAVAEAAASVAETPAKPAAQPTAPAAAGRNLRLKKVNNNPPKMCTEYSAPLAGPASPWVHEAVANFRDYGITVLKVDAAQAIRWRESLGSDAEVGSYWPNWDWSGAPIKLRSAVRKTSSMPKSVVDELREIFSSEDYEAFFRAVVGCGITVANCRPVKSYPHADEGVGPQSWHGDGCPAGVIRGVLYLTPVDAETGPFQYLTPSREVVTMTGEIGDLMVFDASRLVHRAMPPVKKTRHALDFILMPRLPGTKLDVKALGSNTWPYDPFRFSDPKDNSSTATAVD